MLLAFTLGRHEILTDREDRTASSKPEQVLGLRGQCIFKCCSGGSARPQNAWCQRQQQGPPTSRATSARQGYGTTATSGARCQAPSWPVARPGPHISPPPPPRGWGS